ncbi:hypothetical protein LUZ63_011951 [Rhynchospora breviuscula]|uniref:ABC transporter domain-containing protein n=1 Tax=Rhynchospora breviuscula TaxID=2022672 RepID=A0A9Q0CJZ5_9POAL|nr:hypothetical protein LUZ63_011951 [Rhynchospora breviuscula]
MSPHEADSGGCRRNESIANPNVAVHPSPSTTPTSCYLQQTANPFPVILKFEEVVYKVKVGQENRWWQNMCGSTSSTVNEKTILNGMSGFVCPGEMLAMLGPSGSGKTTLLTALGGRLGTSTNTGTHFSGKITYNGQPFSGAMRRRTGFVAQDDVLYPHLTVVETLRYTALLRLPSTLSTAEKAAHAEAVMVELGLTKVAHSMIGGVRGVRGLSGGERKRVSIGLEMLVNPSLLLLDEPTSGLDSTTASKIIGTLKRMSVQGQRTVVVTIHQPSSRLYHMFDKVLLLSSDGCPIFYGRAADALSYFSSIGFVCSLSINPADLMLDLANGIVPVSTQSNCDNADDMGSSDKCRMEVKEKLVSAYDRHIATKLKTEICSVDPATLGYMREVGGAAKKRAGEWSTTWWEQFSVLLRRGLKERRHESFSKLRMFQVLSVAFLGGLLWWHTPQNHIQDRTALIFFFSVFWGFFPLYNAVFTFPLERPMLLRERSSGMYRLSSYFLARTVGDLPMELGLPTAFTIIIYWMGSLSPNPATFIVSLCIVLFSVLVAQSLGLAVGAVLMEVKQGTTLASVITMAFLIAGGYYVQHIPPFIAWLKYLSYSFYCYKLLLGVQFSEKDYYECASGVMCPVTQFPAIKAVGLDYMWVAVCIMAFMLVGYRLVAYVALQRLQSR